MRTHRLWASPAQPSCRPLSAVALMVMGGLAGAGITLGLQHLSLRADARPNPQSPYAKLAVFARVLHYIETDYVDPVDRRAAIDNAIRGLLRGLDPHTQYFTAEQVRLLRAQLTGHYVGVGLTVTRRRGQAVVLGVESGSPAARAGIRPGDRILRIDGKSVAHLDGATITLRLRGRQGSPVVLEMARPGQPRRRRFTLARAWMHHVNVRKALLPGGLGYIAVRRFARGVTRDVRHAIRSLRRARPGGLRGLVLDLRDNPGGLMDEAVRLADLFVSGGVLVTQIGKRGRLRVRELAHPVGTLRRLPLVLLVNRGTASAAEVVAGCLKDHRRARLLGTRTFGKGSMQSVIPLPGGARLKLTVARYYRPSGRPIDQVGILPDVSIPSGVHPPLPPRNATVPARNTLPNPPPNLGRWLAQDSALRRASRLLSAQAAPR